MTRVNLITGFLGAGKTTLIQHWLSHKPAAEHWAVLVNEFGEFGLDGALLAGHGGANVTVKEVPGGCLCCVNGLPFSVALQQLIGRVKPHRLLIEPSGLGHPRAILQQLRQPQYARHLVIGATFTLVDARQLDDARYTEHALFNEQLQVADCLLAAKADLYLPVHHARLRAYAAQLGLATVPRLSVQRGCAPFTDAAAPASRPDFAPLGPPVLTLPPVYNNQGYVYRSRQADGYWVQGWAFRPTLVFALAPLRQLLGGLACTRLKAIMRTPEGILSFNRAGGALSEQWLAEAPDSRLDILHPVPVAHEALCLALLAAASDERRASDTSV